MDQEKGNPVVKFQVIQGRRNMSLGRNLAHLRKARGWTQEELSKKTAVPIPSIRRYEVGRYTPNADVLAKLAKGLGCSIDEIVFGRGDGSALSRVTDPDLIRQFEEIQQIQPAEREPIKIVLESFIVFHKLTQIVPKPTNKLETAHTRKDIKLFLDHVTETMQNPSRRGPR